VIYQFSLPGHSPQTGTLYRLVFCYDFLDNIIAKKGGLRQAVCLSPDLFSGATDLLLTLMNRQDGATFVFDAQGREIKRDDPDKYVVINRIKIDQGENAVPGPWFSDTVFGGTAVTKRLICLN
jgi:hypothetical protein